MNTAQIIEKWYKLLNFSSVYDAEFYSALNEIEIVDIKINEYDTEEKNGRKNFLSYLYMCEELSRQYKQKGIPEEILFDTLSDIGRWLNIWSELKGELHLGELTWLKNHLSMRLFQLGRLQFALGKAECDITEKNIKKGDNIIEVHIPQNGPLKRKECENSFDMAKKFFREFFPEHKYKYFTCHSWLMDRSLKKLLKPDSNILVFQDMFEVFNAQESYAALKYVFKWDTTKENLSSYACASDFARNIKEWVNKGEKLYEALGVIDAID